MFDSLHDLAISLGAWQPRLPVPPAPVPRAAYSEPLPASAMPRGVSWSPTLPVQIDEPGARPVRYDPHDSDLGGAWRHRQAEQEMSCRWYRGRGLACPRCEG